MKLAPTHAGITVGPDGGSHQMIEDLALMRVLPGMRVLVPADYNAAKAAHSGWRRARRGRSTSGSAAPTLPEVYPATASSSRSARPTCCARAVDVTLAACGVEVAEALAAADMLAAEGISAEVIDVATDQADRRRDADLRASRKTGRVVTCEEHSVLGGHGLGGLRGPVGGVPGADARVGVADVFGTSGEPAELMEHFGLTADDIAAAATGASRLGSRLE